MKITVIGGTGLIGSKLVSKLRQLDHIVIAASPETGINTITGEGLSEALRNADVVVDVANSPSFEDRAVMDFFRRSTMSVLTGAMYARVKHYVAMSIVGSDRLPDSGYLRAKLAQEELIKVSGIPYTILRSTQFFEFASKIAQAATTREEVHIPSAAFQPVAADEVVAVLKDLVLGAPLNGTIEVAGPVRMPMYEFIKYYMESIEDPRQLIKDDQARYFGAKLNDESLVPGQNAYLGRIKFEEWFNTQLVS